MSAEIQKRGISSDEVKGFALSDAIVRIIFINPRDYDAPKNFTFAHEIAHIWIGQSGISNPEEIPTTTHQPATELFCNAVATEVLVPEREFSALWQNTGSYGEIENLSIISM